MGISDVIAGFINEMLESDENGCAEMQRSDLAQKFGCVPSQINYVIHTRFSPEHGYSVESRRGGGGYIRIRRVHMDSRTLIMHTVNAVGDDIDQNTVRAFVANLLGAEAIEEGCARLMMAALSDNALKSVPLPCRDTARAGIFKQMLINSVN